MKRTISLLLTLLFAASLIQAQTPETLTNISVIKMSKANLSEEIIIDMIRSSAVRFDLSDTGLKGLVTANVSPGVIEAMKTTGGKKEQPVVKQDDATGKKTVEVLPEPEQKVTYVRPADKAPEIFSTMIVTGLNYVAPLTELVKFNENQFKGLEATIAGWDKQMLDYLAEIEKVNGQIFQVESELRELKNADAKAYNADILSLIKKLSLY
ncbi:MAG: hypothetical protein IH593_13880, partial [Bacteroidales bacterium]|nr:hypothetical protein [Bacteroidales bacterium]